MEKIWELTQASLKADPSYRNMFHLLENYPENIAAEVLGPDGNVLTRTYSEYLRLSYAAAGNLQRIRPLGKDEIVGFLYDTTMDWPVLFWAILMSGGIPLLMNPALDPALSDRIMKEAGASAYVSAVPVSGSSAEWIDSGRLLQPGEAGEEKWAEYVALCTSGTTGSSRIFLYHARTIVSQLLSFDEAKQKNEDMPFIEGRPCKLLAFLPFHHVFGFSVIYILYSVTGKTIVYLRDKSVQSVLEACRVEEVTHLYCVPMFFNALAAGIRRQVGDPSVLPEPVKAKVRAGLLGTAIRSMITGGGHVSAQTLAAINDIGYPLYNGFGMTECGIISVEMSADPEQRKKGSIGIPFGITEFKLEPEGNGELFIRGDALYTASVIDGKIVPRDREQWFGTGDLVRREPDGLYMEGRTKDVIVGASGENIYPDELEEKFAGLPGVSRFCILGVRDGTYDAVSLIFEAEGEGTNPADVAAAVDHLNTMAQQNERIQKLYIARAMLPTSGSMKIKRQLLKTEIEGGRFPCEEIPIFAGADMPPEEMKEPEPAEPGEVRDRIRAIVLENLHCDDDFGDNAHFVYDLGGDSLGIYSVVCDIEKAFNIILPDSELRQMLSVSACVNIVNAKLNGTAPAAETVREEKPQKRITDFSESEEYISLKQRMEDTFRDCDNPYFLPHDSLINDTSVIRGNRVINLGSYNYLGMSGHPETEEAAIEAIRKYGTSASGSRTLAGEKTLYQQLEKTIAAWKHTEDAIVCTGGWATNLTFISSWMREGDFILYDALSHNSIAEGVELSHADSKAFAHNDLEMLESLLKKIEGRYNKVLIVVEGVYSMDGDIAPIPDFVRLKKQYGCFLMVDEAHSGGVIGENGGGVDDYFHLDPHDIDIKYGTMSKALGTCGGYIAADRSIVEYLRYSMSGFVFTAGIAPPLAAACMKAIELIQRDNTMVTKLHRNVEYFTRRCREEGMNIGLAGSSAIVPVLIGSDQDAARLSSEMIRQGVFVPPAMYPAVRMGESRLRFTISATHSEEQLEKAVTVLAGLMRRDGLLT